MTDERQADALARDLRDLARVDLQKLDGTWEVTVDGVVGDKLVVRVLNAVRLALAGEPASRALVLLNGREYELSGE